VALLCPDGASQTDSLDVESAEGHQQSPALERQRWLRAPIILAVTGVLALIIGTHFFAGRYLQTADVAGATQLQMVVDNPCEITTLPPSTQAPPSCVLTKDADSGSNQIAVDSHGVHTWERILVGDATPPDGNGTVCHIVYTQFVPTDDTPDAKLFTLDTALARSYPKGTPCNAFYGVWPPAGPSQTTGELAPTPDWSEGTTLKPTTVTTTTTTSNEITTTTTPAPPIIITTTSTTTLATVTTTLAQAVVVFTTVTTTTQENSTAGS